MLRISLFGPPNRHIQPERYVPFALKFIKNGKNERKEDWTNIAY
jgi:hypothetical protein